MVMVSPLPQSVFQPPAVTFPPNGAAERGRTSRPRVPEPDVPREQPIIRVIPRLLDLRCWNSSGDHVTVKRGPLIKLLGSTFVLWGV